MDPLYIINYHAKVEQPVPRFNNIDSIELDLHNTETHDIDSMNYNKLYVSKKNKGKYKGDNGVRVPNLPLCEYATYKIYQYSLYLFILSSYVNVFLFI